MTPTGRRWVAPTLVALGVFALVGGAGFFHVLLVMTGVWWLLTRTGSPGRHAATTVASVQAPARAGAPTPPPSDAAYWPALPSVAGTAAVWSATRERTPEVTGSDAEDEDEESCVDELDSFAGGWHTPVDDLSAGGAWGGSGGGGSWDAADDFGGYGGGGDWGDDFGGHGGGGDWGDD